MPLVPGVPGANLPAGDDAIIRRIQELERAQRELLPAVMAAVGPAISDLQTQVAQINALIAATVAFGSVGASTVGALAVTPTGADVAIQNVTIPAGFTQATILCIADATIYNTSGTSDYAFVSASIDSIAGGEEESWVANGYAIGISSSAIRTLTGLTPGGTIPVAGHIRTNVVNFPAQTSTNVNVNAIALFLR